MRVTVKAFCEVWINPAFHDSFEKAVSAQNVHHTGSAGYWDEQVLHNITKELWYLPMKPQPVTQTSR